MLLLQMFILIQVVKMEPVVLVIHIAGILEIFELVLEHQLEVGEIGDLVVLVVDLEQSIDIEAVTQIHERKQEQ